jgi:uncharacterized membrane protein
MESYINSSGFVLAVISLIVAIAFYLLRYKFFKTFGPPIICIILGIILSNSGLMPHWNDVYGVIFQYAIPISIAMFMLNVDLKAWKHISKQPLLAVFFAVLSVSVVALLVGVVFATKIDEGWKIAGMFVGTYTGGSSNLTAIGTGLGATPSTFAAANAADYIIGMPSLIFFFAVPGILAKWKGFKKIWPYTLSEEELATEDDTELFAKKEWSITDIALLFAIGFVVTEIATFVSSGINPMISSAVRILLITTISIVLAQLGLLVDIKEFATSTPLIAIFCGIVIIASLVLHILLCRLFKIKYQYVLISIVAAIGDGTSAAMVAGAGNWKSIMSIAIVLGVMGAALGNYVGIGVAYAIKMIVGM